MADDSIRVLAGDCTVSYADADGPTREERGRVVIIEKPDGTVLVHDRDGYRPVAWLTRADAVAWDRTGARPALSAVDGDRRLTVACHEEVGRGSYPASTAGTPVGECPACGGALLRAPKAVECLDCGERHGVPRDATLGGEDCEACGLPRMGVDRGERFSVCVDRTCESLDDAVRARFDREWTCPDCGDDLRIIRRGGLLAGCDGYPDCEVAFAIPAGRAVGECEDCGLPRFETPGGGRCLDAACSGGGQDRSDR